MEIEKLLPCPFCGGEASLTIPSEHVQADCADIYVSCDECEAEGQHFVVEMQDRTPDLWPYEQRDAIAAWNTRAPADLRSALEAETIEKLRDAAALVARAIGVTQMPDGTASTLVFSGNAPGPQLEDILSARAAIASLEGHVS